MRNKILAKVAFGMLLAIMVLNVGDSQAQPIKDDRGIKVIGTASSIQEWGNYYALIIGINSYREWPTLNTAANDASALGDILVKHYGFSKDQVILRINDQATLSMITNDLRNLAGRMKATDNLLIYFAGHGQLDDLTGEGYWIPLEGKLKDPSTWLAHSTVKNILSSDRVKAKNIVVVADSCYSGTLLRGGPSLLSMADARYQERLRELSGKKSRQVITSGGNEPVGDKGREGHSLFAYYFLQALRENDRNFVDLENLFLLRVWKPVTEIGGQRPNMGRLKTPMDEDGQFVLVRAAGAGSDSGTDAPALEEERRKLGEERKKLEEETARVAALSKLIEEQRKIKEERKKLEEEQKRLEDEKKKREEELKRVSLAKTPSKTFTNSIGMKFVLIPAGKFIMGSPSNELGRVQDEGPQHEVEITRPFYLSQYEVTQGQWKAVMGNNPSHFKDCGDNCPVENVSWYDVQEFVRKLNQMEGIDRYRLPTEAEWEYAYRAGSRTAYSFGSDSSRLGDYAWYDKNSGNKTHSVGEKKPNAWGLYDMHGNVWEWVQDWYDEGYYRNSPREDPKGPNNGKSRVVRGGSWKNDSGSGRASNRVGINPAAHGYIIGFRLALPSQ